MRKVLAIAAIIILTSVFIADRGFCGWKENYRTKYSKKQLDPNSERAKEVRRLANPDATFIKKWRMTDEERKAAGLPIRRTLTENLMAWKTERGERDNFQKYECNFTSANKEPAEARGAKSGRTLKGFIQEMGGTIGNTLKEETSKINDRINEEGVK